MPQLHHLTRADVKWGLWQQGENSDSPSRDFTWFVYVLSVMFCLPPSDCS